MKGNFNQKWTFLNFGEILEKIIQYRDTSIYDNVYPDDVKKVFSQKVFQEINNYR